MFQQGTRIAAMEFSALCGFLSPIVSIAVQLTIRRSLLRFNEL